MTSTPFTFIYAFIISLTAVSAMLPGTENVNDTAFLVVWAAMSIAFGMVTFALWHALRDEEHMLNNLREIASEPESPVADTFRVLLLLAAILINGWWFTAIVYMALEVSALVIVRGIRLFVAKHDAEAQIDTSAPATNDSAKTRGAA